MKHLLSIALAVLTLIPTVALACEPSEPWGFDSAGDTPACLSMDVTYGNHMDGAHGTRDEAIQIENNCDVVVTVTPVDCEICDGGETIIAGESVLIGLTLPDDVEYGERFPISWSALIGDSETTFDSDLRYYTKFNACQSGCSTVLEANSQTGWWPILLFGFALFLRRRPESARG